MFEVDAIEIKHKICWTLTVSVAVLAALENVRAIRFVVFGRSFRVLLLSQCSHFCGDVKLRNRSSWKFTRAKASQKHEIKNQ